MDAAWIRRTIEAFPGVELIHSYGLTETSPILTTLGWAQHLAGLEGGDRLRSVGRPLVGVELRIVDDDGTDVPSGDAGEIAVRAPNVSAGYLDRPDETEAVFRGVWFFTGDVGRLDDDGYLHLFDRKKDVIITGGENVWSTEVEAALYAHPDVVEAAVIGVPDETWGEALLAVIVAAPGSRLASGDGEEALVAHCRERIGGYKVPRRYRFVDALPKSAMGKILKAELRERYRDAGA
jgi:long-chain acyl-CoA synthetase